MNIRRNLLLCLVCLLVAVAFVSKTALAQPVEIIIAGEPPWKIQADEIATEKKDQVYLARGHVRMSRGDEFIQGDQARYHADTKMAEIRGRVVMSAADFKITCQRLVINVELNIGKIYDGTVFFPANHYYISGDEIERTGPDTFLVIHGRATTCDGPAPAWALTGENITVEKEGYATARHATFETRLFPLLYFPWLKVPVKAQRQSGLLVPGLSNSTRDGFVFSQPFYWAVNDNKDLTLYLTYMTERGLESTLEGRYNDWGGKGTYRLTYLKDNKPPTIYYQNPKRSKVQEDRYWIRGMSDHKTSRGFEVKFDLDYASDPKYLDEFSGSFTGYNATRQQFLNEFGRELAEPLDPLRRTTLQTAKSINHQTLRFGLEYTQNLKDPNNLETIQRLPRVGLDLTRQAIPGTPLYFSSVSEYTFFARETNSETRLTEEGHRLDVHPRLHWPMNLGGYIQVEPSAGVRETLYYPHGMRKNPTDPSDTDRDYRFYWRQLFDATVEASTSLSRVYDLDLGRIERIKHRLKPEVTFSLVTEKDQRELPYWDRVDRISERRQIRYGLVNYLVAKVRREPPRFQSSDSSDAAAAALAEEYVREGRNDYEYQDFFKLGLHRVYDFVKEPAELDETDPLAPWEIHQPHSPWEIDLELDFSPWFWVQANSKYDTYAEHFTDHAVTAQVNDRRGDYLSLDYELHLEPYLPENRRFEYEEIRGLINVVLDEEWSAGFWKRYSLADHRDVETAYYLKYQPQCWGLRLVYSDKPDDKSIAIFLSLLGLGEVGGFTHQTESRPSTRVVREEERP
ncbi:MAG: LPS assembly protein LptD [Thermodesulfobacteriota bacterium]